MKACIALYSDQNHQTRGAKINPDTLRNLMDMKASMGSFVAALKDKNAWVTNVVAEDGPNTLKIIYDGGLISTIHNWCEAFSTCCYLF